MKCIYYLSPNLISTHKISDDLHETGVNDWFIHIVSKDEAGLQREHLHSSNYLETLDFIRDGFIGAACGFVAGAAFAYILNLTQPFGPDVPLWAYLAVIALLTFFGAWQGGLIGVASENKKMARFHDDIEKGKYLVLIYAKKNQEEAVKSMMAKKHSAAQLVAIDTHFMNPFARPDYLQQTGK